MLSAKTSLSLSVLALTLTVGGSAYARDDRTFDVVEEALETAMAGATKNNDNPNRRGNALYHLCQQYLQTIRGTS